MAVGGMAVGGMAVIGLAQHPVYPSNLRSIPIKGGLREEVF
jgi:hypothetical protein